MTGRGSAAIIDRCARNAARGSSEKKEKRRRRNPAKGPNQPELIGPDVFLRNPIERSGCFWL